MSGWILYPEAMTDAEWEILELVTSCPVAIGGECEILATRDCQRDSLRTSERVPLAAGSPRFTRLGSGVLLRIATWRKDGIWDQIQKSLLKRVRKAEGRNEEPSAAVIDSQSIKTSAVRGPEKGIDFGRLIWGRKRHVLVDTQGNR